ncbi:tyrosine-protein phosphatase non-receptor type 18 isoform X2 [Myripristis murdjan]|uniref:tyrosine-protein phosphatase non-receptor type 18 isoform X2 n=1 Tax=Myripristis murdjan TaxID=586833 RepID=UPI0011763AB9|nr:tyrosine-protein phosphatase non-receptor type 18 isoform X2 [Myripristis murdjan]
MDVLPTLLRTLRSDTQQAAELQYNTVRSQSLRLKTDLSLSSEAGALKENIKKNRYKDILPYDQTRVVLSLLTSDSDRDYINASFIQGATAGRRYIATQGPLSSTLLDFWRMTWQHGVKVIIMACREVEMGKKKCECYWAPLNQSTSFGPFTVCNQGETRPNEDIVIRTLTVTYQQETRPVCQYQFLSWPDHDVPSEAARVLNLLDRARSTQGASTSPLLVHCSAGCGRTGVICALDYIYDLLVTKLTPDFSIMQIVLQLRRQRPSAVQTKDQYQFIFTAVVCMFERVLQSADSMYCNLPQGKPAAYHEPDPLRADRPTATAHPLTKRSSLQTDMNDTYAVVNKPRQAHADAGRAPPSSHHYDNDPPGAAAAPLYSAVRPRARPISSSHSATPIYDTAAPANPRAGEGPLLLCDSGGYSLVTAVRPPSTDDEYEYVQAPLKDASSYCPPGGIGFNCRIQKPKGPRDPPAEWSRLER